MKAVIGEKVFNGTGPLLSEELIQYVNQSKNEYMHLTAFLAKNKTGYVKSEAIYLINNKDK